MATTVSRWIPICRFPGQSRLQGRVKSVSCGDEPVPAVIGVDRPPQCPDHRSTVMPMRDFDNFTTQVHDFDPGITPYPSGLFWTVPLTAPDGVDVQYAAGKARMSATNLSLLDYFNIPNAFFRFEDPVDATCSFDIHWSPPVADRIEGEQS
jgi:hypothetical protein